MHVTSSLQDLVIAFYSQQSSISSFDDICQQNKSKETLQGTTPFSPPVGVVTPFESDL